MIRRINPDEALTLNGVNVTAWQLAEARQQLSHEGVYNPTWAELGAHDQEMGALAAGSYLRALARLLPDTDAPRQQDPGPRLAYSYESCDYCTCCSRLGCYRGRDSTCPTNDGGYLCPCTGE